MPKIQELEQQAVDLRRRITDSILDDFARMGSLLDEDGTHPDAASTEQTLADACKAVEALGGDVMTSLIDLFAKGQLVDYDRLFGQGAEVGASPTPPTRAHPPTHPPHRAARGPGARGAPLRLVPARAARV